MRVIKEPVAVHADERGFVFEPMAFEPLSRQRNIHVVVTLPGFIRGNHYHRRAVEIVAVLGPALVRFREDESVEDVTIGEGEAVRFTFPPGVAHAIQNTGDRPSLLIAFADSVHDPTAPDVVRETLIDA
jgi:UDP-2-acetamido-2,6-beta-L-arabino-hexul-4-ose reductase